MSLFRDVPARDWIITAIVAAISCYGAWWWAHDYYGGGRHRMPRWFDRHVYPILRPIYDRVDPPPVIGPRRLTP